MISDKYAPHRKYCWVKEQDVIEAFKGASGNLEEATRLINRRGYKINKFVLQTRKNQLLKDGVFPRSLCGVSHAAYIAEESELDDLQKLMEEAIKSEEVAI